MNTFIQYLIEQQQDYKTAVETVYHDCHPFIKEIRYSPRNYSLFRGMQSIPLTDQQIITHSQVRQQRQPRTTPNDIHQLLDQFMQIKFGHPYRSQSLIATGFGPVAAHFGHPYVVWPVGDFTFLWSRKINDLWHERPDMKELIEQLQQAFNHEKRIEMKKQLTQIYKQFKFTTQDLPKAVLSGHEIMINCDSYYITHPPDTEAGDNFLKYLGDYTLLKGEWPPDHEFAVD